MSELMGKTAFVTGATGFLGGALVHRLVAEGVRVKALARRKGRDSYIRDLDGVDIVMGDLSDEDRLAGFMQGCELVFHVAAATNGRREKQYHANVLGTRYVARAAAKAHIECLVHVSTVATYGYPSDGIISEDTPQKPGNVLYNRTKLMAETELIQVADEFSLAYSIIRPAMIYGPRSGMWTKQMFQLAARQPVLFVGDGRGTAYPIFVDDVVDLMIVLASHPDAVGEAFNCAPDPCPTWREFLGAYMQLAGHDRWLPLPPKALRLVAPVADLALTLSGTPQDIRDIIPFITGDTCYSMDKARDFLGWQASVRLEDGIARCVPYLRDEGLL